MNPGAETYQINLHRNDLKQPWGFRLQGGADFSTPLSIQLVNPGSLAEQCNLRPGDAVLNINGKPSAELEHEKAKYEILMAQYDLNLLIQRGAVNVWKPKVTPLSDLRPSELQKVGGEDDIIVQRTSLAADKQEPLLIGSNYNRSARPFAGFGGGAPAAPPQQQQYAPPPPPPQQQQQPPPVGQYGGQQPYGAQSQGYSGQGMYGAQQEMGSSQAGGYGGGYGYGGAGLQSSEAPIMPAPAQQAYAAPPPPPPSQPGPAPGMGGGGNIPGFKSVKAPVTKPPSERPQQQHPVCAACGGLIVGVFVKISGEPLHPECFKCNRCGKNLKNQGHFTVEGKKYCDVCAPQVAAPPGADMSAIPVYR